MGATALPGADTMPATAGTDTSPSPALTPPPGNPRFERFDALRAIAALAVLLYHAGYYSRANEGTSGLSPYLARLNVGVAVFFAISGFLLYRPLLAARMGQTPPVRLRDYARRRFLRIVPGYWVALTVLAIYPGLTGLFGGRSWIYYGFGQDYSVSTVTGGIGPAWSLGCEVVFYALLPFISLGLAAAARRVSGGSVSIRLEVGMLAALALASAAWRAYAINHPSIPSATFVSTFGWFAAGMLVAVASVSWTRRPTPLTSSVARYAWLGWILAAVAYLVICRGLRLPSGFVFFERLSRAQDLEVYVLSGVVAAGMILPAAFAPARGRAGSRRRGVAVLTWLGVVSYGIYLYHQPIADALNGGVRSGGDSTTRFLWLAAATAAIAIAGAAVSYYVVERPALRLKDRRRAPAARTVSAGPQQAVLRQARSRSR
jgi:peptidoglycan/LPS O-acetylase OafA/YrhL